MSEEEVAACLAKHLRKQAEQYQAETKAHDRKLKRLTAPERWAELKAWIKKTVALVNKGIQAGAMEVHTISRNELHVDATYCGRKHSALICFAPENGNIAYAINGSEFALRSGKEDASAEDVGKSILHTLLGVV